MLTIVTPSFNQAPLLRACLARVDGLRGVTEHIVVDGASTDGSVEVLQQSAVQWTSEPDEGMYDALSRGFSTAQGEVLGWINCDDALMPWTPELVLDVFRRHPDVDFIYGDAIQRWPNGRASLIVTPPRRLLARYFRHGGFLIQPSVFFRRSLFERVGGLDTQMKLLGDHELWHRFVDAGARAHRVFEVLSVATVVEGQLMQRFAREAEAERLKIASRYGLGVERSIAAHVDRVMHRAAMIAILAGDRRRAWRRGLSRDWVCAKRRRVIHALSTSTAGRPYLDSGPALSALMAVT